MFSDDLPSRRSARNAPSTVVVAEPSRPRFTASGRQIRSRAGGLYGEALLTGQREDSDYDEEDDEGRPQRTRTVKHPNGYSGYGIDDLEDESEAIHSNGNESGNDWDGGEDDENDFEGDDEGEDASGDESIMDGEPPSLVVQLRYGKGNAPGDPKVPLDEPPSAQDAQMKDANQEKASAQAPAPLQATSLPTAASEPLVNRPPETVQAAPTVAASSFPIVPTLQQATQPAPTMAAPPMPTGSHTKGPISQAPVNGATMPSAPMSPVPSLPEVPKTTQLTEPNGLVGPGAGAESRPGPEIPRSQAPFTQGWNATS